MKYSILLIIITLTSSMSCNSDKMKQNLSLLYSSPINIPNKISTLFNGEDTLINDMFISKLKLVIYTDSTSCSTCGINKIFMWKPLLNYAKMYNGNLKFYFIFYPTNASVDKLRIAMTLDQLNYPMLIDINGDFEKSNPHMPKNRAFHTFLLDENNKVILVGNPLHNKEIEKLFYKKTQELLSK